MVFVVFYLLVLQICVNSQPNCDQTKTPNVTEGNIGETKHYPWLGVLRVHSHDGKKLKIGLTGLVLIKHKYGVVNAHDVAGMHKSDLANRDNEEEMRVIFLSQKKCSIPKQ